MIAYLAVGGVAALATYLLTFVARRIAIRMGAVVAPDERRVHERPTPDAGGVAMFLALIIAIAVASRVPYFEPMFSGSSAPFGILLASGIVFAVGLIDDFREISAPAKLAGLVLGGSVLSFLGVAMSFFRVPFADTIVLGADMAPLATVIWVAAMANAVNLIDGLDGLAAGIVAIAAGAFFIYGNQLANSGLLDLNNPAPLVAIITCGICLGFLPHNFHPARIFMGDSGALLLGLLMAASTLLVGGGTDTESSGSTFFFLAPVFIPFFILGVPMLDTLFAIIRRAARRSGVSLADRDHLHYRLERMGHGHRRSVLILWAWTALLSGFVLYPTFADRGNHIIPFGVAALCVALYTLFHPGVRQRNEQLALVNGADDRRRWRRTGPAA